MTFYIILSIISISIILIMIGIKIIEKKRGKTFYSHILEEKYDPKIRKIWVAFIKNVGRIWKLISRQVSKLPKITARGSHSFWKKMRNKIDYIFEKIHRNPKLF